MFLFQNDDAFLVLENAVKEISRILRASGKGPLHRTWVDLPYGEEEICLLEDELLPIAQMVLDRIEEIDLKIQVEQERKWAEEYIEAMQLILRADKQRDHIICTGRMTTLEYFVEKVFAGLNLEWRNHVDINSSLKRPSEIKYSVGNPLPMLDDHGWKARNDVDGVIQMLIDYLS